MKRTYHPSKPRGNPSARLNIAVLACLFLLIIWGIFLVRNKLLYNAYDMGTRLANSYASEEEDRLAVYELFLDLDPSISANGLRPAQTKSFCSDGWPVIPPIFPRYWVQVSSIPTLSSTDKS